MLLLMAATGQEASHVRKMVLVTKAAETIQSRVAEQMMMGEAEQKMS